MKRTTEADSNTPTGKLHIVGISSGDNGLLIPAAKEALIYSDVIVGYKTYIR